MTIHLKLQQKPTPTWTDAHLVSGVYTPPYIVANSPATFRFLYTNAAGDAVVSASGITDILCEVWSSQAMKTGGQDGILIAPAAVSVTTAAPLIADWNAATGSYYTATVTMTATETAAAITVMDDDASGLQGWMEVRGTMGGQNVLLGSGPLMIHKGSTGGTPPAGPDTYYTTADADATFAKLAFKTISVSGQTDIVADALDDTLTLVAGTNITLTTSGDTLTIDATGGGGGGSGANLTTTRNATTVTVLSDTGTDAILVAADGTNAGVMTAADKTKLDGVATGATANAGTVTTVSVVTANGVSGSVATATSTPAITLTLGAITPISLAATGNITTSAGGVYSGTANTANGSLTLYGDAVAGSTSILSTVATMAREWDFPDANGTFASQEWVGQWTGSTNITTIGTIASPVFTGSIGIPAGTVTVPGLAFTDDADGSGTGIYRSALNELSIASNGVQSIKVAATGITTVTNATASTSSTTGGLVVTGGIGASQNCNFGQNLTVQIGTYSPIFGAVSGGVVKLTGSTAGADCTRVSFQFTPSTSGSALTISGTTLSTALGTGVAGGTFATTGGRVITSSIKTTTYTVTANDDYLVANSGTPFTITLIAASANTGRRFIFSNKGAGTLTIDATGLGQITRGSAANTTTLTTGQSVELVSDGATWVGPAAPAGSGNAQTADPLSQFAATTSAQLAGVISDETGSGKLVFGTSPVLYGTPVLGDDTVAGLLQISGDSVAPGNYLTVSFPGSTGAQTWAFPDSSGTGATQEWVGTWTGSTNITTLGTVTTGTWSATTIAVNKGGTGLTSLTANNVVIGNGTSVPLFVAPGTSGNVLTSNGTTWQSAAPTGGSSPTTTRGDLIRRGASADERLAIGAAGSRLTSDGTDAQWYRPSKFAEWYDDFMGSSLANPANSIGWDAGGSGTTTFTSESGRPGIAVMGTGTATTGSYRISAASSSLRLGGGVLYWETSVKLSALSDAIDEYDLRLGLGDTSAAAHADGVYFEYDRQSSTDWRYVTAKASTRTEHTGETPTAVAAGSWIKLAFEVNAAASQVKFYVNGTLVRTDSGVNIPNTDSNLCGFYNHIVKSAGTTARTCSIDYIYACHLLTTER